MGSGQARQPVQAAGVAADSFFVEPEPPSVDVPPFFDPALAAAVGDPSPPDADPDPPLPEPTGSFARLSVR